MLYDSGVNCIIKSFINYEQYQATKINNIFSVCICILELFLLFIQISVLSDMYTAL